MSWPIITFDEADLVQSGPLPPGWYRVVITNIGQRPASGQNPLTTMVWPIDAQIIKNVDTGSTEFAGSPTPSNWMLSDNPKAKRMLANFFRALGAEVKPGSRIALKAAEGKELEVYIAHETWEGRIVAKVKPQYRRVTPDQMISPPTGKPPQPVA